VNVFVVGSGERMGPVLWRRVEHGLFWTFFSCVACTGGWVELDRVPGEGVQVGEVLGEGRALEGGWGGGRDGAFVEEGMASELAGAVS
jgi:hypothetical protein